MWMSRRDSSIRMDHSLCRSVLAVEWDALPTKEPMTARFRYRVALTLTVVLVVLTFATCWFVATFAGLQAVLLVGFALLPCLAFCCWRTWTSRVRLRP